MRVKTMRSKVTTMCARLIALAGLCSGNTTGQTPQSRVVVAEDRFVVEYGPLHLGARGYRDAMKEPPAVTILVPEDGWMRGYSIELLDSTGRRLPQQMLHHLNLMMKGRRDLFNRGMLRVGAAGPETAPVELPHFLGVPASRGDTLLMTFMLYNPTQSSIGGITLRVVVPFTSATARLGAMAIYPVSVAIGPRGRPNLFDLPPGHSEHVWEGSPYVAGRVIGLSGHMHRYGVSLTLDDRTTGKRLWSVTPTPAKSAEVMTVPRTHIIWPFGIPLRTDHVYRVTAVYENPTGQLIPSGGMGVMGGIMMISGSALWPLVDRTDAEYIDDVRSIVDPVHPHVMHGYAVGAPPRQNP